MRFHHDDINMTNIEVMFHQVLFPENNRSLFRFLWWKSCNINGKGADFEMGDHVFRGISASSCCDYELPWTASDHETKIFSRCCRYFEEVVLCWWPSGSSEVYQDCYKAGKLPHQNVCKGDFVLPKFASNKVKDKFHRKKEEKVWRVWIYLMEIICQYRLEQNAHTIGIVHGSCTQLR